MKPFEVSDALLRNEMIWSDMQGCGRCGFAPCSKDRLFLVRAYRSSDAQEPSKDGLEVMCRSCFHASREQHRLRKKDDWRSDKKGIRTRSIQAKARKPHHGEVWAVDFGKPYGVRRVMCMRGSEGVVWVGGPDVDEYSKATTIGRVRK